MVAALLVVGVAMWLINNVSSVGWILIGVAVVGLAVFAIRGSALRHQQRRETLIARFGPDIAERILAGQYWQGATSEMLTESLGAPLDVKERVLKTKTKHTYCYQQTAKNRFALKVHLEDDQVVGWDDETSKS